MGGAFYSDLCVGGTTIPVLCEETHRTHPSAFPPSVSPDDIPTPSGDSRATEGARVGVGDPCVSHPEVPEVVDSPRHRRTSSPSARSPTPPPGVAVSPDETGAGRSRLGPTRCSHPPCRPEASPPDARFSLS